MDILQGGDERYVLFPIEHSDIWEMYKKHEAAFWTAEEIDLDVDMKDWNTLSDNEQYFIKMVLAFFAASDGIVCENLVQRFYNDIKCAEARAFYSCQIFMESIHSETYSLLIQTLINDRDEQVRLFRATENVDVIKQKAEWCKKWIDCSDSFAVRLVAFSCVEGIFFSGSFCAIYWLKKRGLMPGLTFSNELIARDEGLHTDFACLIYRKIGCPVDAEKVQDIVNEAVILESKFITSALPCSLIGMNCTLMTQYIKFVADRLLQSLNVVKLYNVEMPFPWMEMISMQGKTNFFEKRVGEYQKSGVMASLSSTDTKFSLDDEF
tara:strand:- start:2553 stop:3518 length:966 start_codon:yes stop_codon:yes gene_type:complete